MSCDCSICRGAELDIPAIALQFPGGSERRALAIKNPSMPVYWYEQQCPNEAPLTVRKEKKKERIGVDEAVLAKYLKDMRK